jgi:hypothetical protein
VAGRQWLSTAIGPKASPRSTVSMRTESNVADIDGDDLTIKAEALGATFRGRWNEDGTVFSGGWRPDPGHEFDPGNVPNDIAGSRVE